MSFLAYRVQQQDGNMIAQWQEMEDSSLPAGEVLIEVKYSSVNYKDALSASGHKGVTREFPHTPGIDAAGVVLESSDDSIKAGDEVVVFGYDLGMNTAGGFAQKIRVPAHWVLQKPANISLKDTMAWGTAGFTAALSVQKLERAGITPNAGPVLVTGATGGVGSVAVSLLAKLNYTVICVTGKPNESDFLKQLGASEIISREDLLAHKGKVMTKPVYQAALDTVGADMVSAIIPQIMLEGAVTTCGMIAGTQIESSIFPFILRGVSLLGVDSVEIPLTAKQNILNKIANQWALPGLNEMTKDIARDELGAILAKILAGQGVGRYRLALQ